MNPIPGGYLCSDLAHPLESPFVYKGRTARGVSYFSKALKMSWRIPDMIYPEPFRGIISH